MAAAAGDVILSGFASIYFERVLKSVEETYSVWDRNFQLAFWSASIYLPILIYDNPTNPFVGWSGVAVACSAVGALGGTHPPQPWGRTPCGVRLQPHLPRLQPHVLQACWWR